MKSIIKKCVHKILCAVERIKYKLLFHDLNLDPWHLKWYFLLQKLQNQNVGDDK